MLSSHMHVIRAKHLTLFIMYEGRFTEKKLHAATEAIWNDTKYADFTVSADASILKAFLRWYTSHNSASKNAEVSDTPDQYGLISYRADTVGGGVRKKDAIVVKV